MNEEQLQTDRELTIRMLKIRKLKLSLLKEQIIHEELCIRDLERELEVTKDWSEHS